MRFRAVGQSHARRGRARRARRRDHPCSQCALARGLVCPHHRLPRGGEEPKAAVEREVKEELNLDVVRTTLIGNYIFERKNEVMLCYHVVATGEVKLGPELSEYRRYQPQELKPWPRATGFAVADWMTARGLPFEYADFPGAASGR